MGALVRFLFLVTIGMGVALAVLINLQEFLQTFGYESSSVSLDILSASDRVQGEFRLLQQNPSLWANSWVEAIVARATGLINKVETIRLTRVPVTQSNFEDEDEEEKKEINECVVLPLGLTPKSTTNKVVFEEKFSENNPAPDLESVAVRLGIVHEGYEKQYKVWCGRNKIYSSLDTCFSSKCGGVMWMGHDGDLWVWALDPGTEKVIKLSDRTVKLKSISLRPNLLEVESILTEEEAKSLKEMADSRLHRSTLHSGGGEAVSTTRTSSTAWVFPSENQAAYHQDILLAELLGLPHKMVADSGAFQVIRYQPGEHYHIHHDAFEVDNEKKEIGVACGRNRFITVLYYLNEVEEGGETNFPSVGRNDTVIHNYQCQQGFNLIPKKLNAAIFYNLDPMGIMNGVRDLWAYHAGCPVKSGIKWASNRWIHNKMRPFPHLQQSQCQSGIPYGWDYQYPLLSKQEL